MARYYIVNFTDASVETTSSDEDARSFATSDEFVVIDTEQGVQLLEDGTTQPIHVAK